MVQLGEADGELAQAMLGFSASAGPSTLHPIQGTAVPQVVRKSRLLFSSISRG